MSRHPHSDPLSAEDRALIDAAIAAKRVQRIDPGVSGTCVPRWRDHSAPRRRVETIANRAQIAPLLAAGKRLSEIARETGIAYETVRRVAAALRRASQGKVEVSAHTETAEASRGSAVALSGAEMGDISCHHDGRGAEKEIGL